MKLTTHLLNPMNRSLRHCVLALLCLQSVAPLQAQEAADYQNLSIQLDAPEWVFNVSSAVLQGREPQLDPSENALGGELRELLNAGDYQGAIQVMEAARAEGQTFGAALNHILGQVYMSEQDYPRAEAAFLAAVEQMPDFARAHQRLGLIYLQNKDFAKAREHLSRAISLGIADAQVFGQLAYANLQDYSAWSAIQGYQLALLLEPGNAQWQQGLLFALVNARHFAAAQALVDEMLMADQDNRALWLQSANIALNNDDAKSALSRLEVALQLGESDPANQVVAAQLHLQHGSSRRAVELMQASLSAGVEYYEPVSEAINWLIYQQQWQDAEQLVHAGLESWSNLSSERESTLLTHRGRIARARDDNEAAGRYLQSAVERNPANGEALLALAELESSQQQYVQAAMHYTRAEAIEEVTERALLGHAQVALDQRDYRQAVELLRRAYQLNPTRADINQNIQTLERIIRNAQ